MKVMKEPWIDFDGAQTEALTLDIIRQYTISEFITLLEEAKRKWGDKTIFIHDMNNNCIGGFSTVYLHKKFDGENDAICIYG